MREIIEALNTPVVGSPLWLWILAGVAIGAALFGYGGGDHDGCPPFAGRC
jgi:hypothetical protein